MFGGAASGGEGETVNRRKNGSLTGAIEGDVIRAGEPALPAVSDAGRVLETVPRVGQLNTVKAVSRELGRLYRAARQGKVDPAIAARLAYTLNILIGGIKAGSWEERLDRLEENANLPRLTESDENPIAEARERLTTAREQTEQREQEAAADAAVIGA